MRDQAGEKGETAEARAEAGTVEATVRLRSEEKERKKQRLSSQNPKLKRTKESENSGGQKEKRKRRQAVKVEAQRSRKGNWKARVSRKKQLQRLKPAEDERKLQTKRFVKQSVWRLKGQNHCLMKSGEKAKQSRLKSRGFFVFYARNRRCGDRRSVPVFYLLLGYRFS